MLHMCFLIVASQLLRCHSYRMEMESSNKIETDLSCDTNKWHHVAQDCGNCTVLASQFFHRYGSCHNYCESEGLHCIGAWEPKGDNSCGSVRKFECHTPDLRSLSKRRLLRQVLCQCEPASSKTCVKKGWPDVKKDCKGCAALVNHMHTRYKTCEKYCRLRGLECVNAYEEEDDDCTVVSKHLCNETGILSARTGKPTSDLICQCKAPGTCSLPELTSVRKDCGDCTALVFPFRRFKTCENFCDAHDLKCIGAWEEEDSTCVKKKKYSCQDQILNEKGNLTTDALCKCE